MVVPERLLCTYGTVNVSEHCTGTGTTGLRLRRLESKTCLSLFLEASEHAKDSRTGELLCPLGVTMPDTA